MGVRVVLALGTLALVGVLIAVLAGSDLRQAGGNNVPEVDEAAVRKGNWRWCQDEIVPKDAARLRFRVGTGGRPMPALDVTARAASGALVTRGSYPAGGPEGRIDVRVEEVDRTMAGVRVCIRARDSKLTALYGNGRRVRLDWFRKGKESWLSLAGPVAHRFGLGKANPVGDLLFWFAALMLMGSWSLTARLLLRQVAR